MTMPAGAMRSPTISDWEAKRPQSRAEEIINSALHAFGALAAAAAGFWLAHKAWRQQDMLAFGAILIFVATMILLYATSALYHIFPGGPTKTALQHLDRTAIAFLIAGTCTPVALLMVRGPLGITLCASEWALALLGAGLMVQDPDRYPTRSAWLYQIMGWLTALAARTFFYHTPSPVLAALALGGLCYGVGVLFLIRDHVRYFHAVFHVWAMLGTALQFWAISQYMG